ncbi:MAG: tetratricopeptide repeat protein, partial [Planctomycetota bacterium]
MLYNEGPSRASEVIDLLKKQLRLKPEHEQAIYLLGVTYFGIGDFKSALQQFDAGIALADKRKSIIPELVFYRARTLFELGRCPEARQLLDSHWAFWQDS